VKCDVFLEMGLEIVCVGCHYVVETFLEPKTFLEVKKKHF